MNRYELIDSGDFRKLEKLGPFFIVRPAAQAVWEPSQPDHSGWKNPDASFHRKTGGEGEWSIKNPSLRKNLDLLVDDINFSVRLTDFGHLGVFPEHHDLWGHLRKFIDATIASEGTCKILNLFAYTGAATLACAAAGAEVAHVDASKVSVTWARENAKLAQLADKPIRWLVEDAYKFAERELRRGNYYHGIILDPPTFGRGPNGESWKIETHLNPLLESLTKLLLRKPGAPGLILLSSHSSGYSPMVLRNLLRQHLGQVKAHEMLADELVIKAKHGIHLPSGAFAMWTQLPQKHDA